jgi:ankyrin repeat protein
MSKYTDKNVFNKYSTMGNTNLVPNIDTEFKNKIFALINTGDFGKLKDNINESIKLTFSDQNNNSVVHLLLNVDNKIIPEDTKLKMLKYFIKSGAPVNTYNKFKKTPLHIAIEKSHHVIVHFLIENGANPNATTLNNYTPIQLAIIPKIQGCLKNIIPEEMFPKASKDRDLIRIQLFEYIKKVLTTDAPKLINDNIIACIKKIFDDYLNVIDQTKETRELIAKIPEEILKIQMSADQLDVKNRIINEKKKEYIKNLVEKFNPIVSDDVDKVLLSIPNVDSMINIYLTSLMEGNVNKTNIQINKLYEDQLDQLKNVINLVEKYYKNFEMNIYNKLIFSSKQQATITHTNPANPPQPPKLNHYIVIYYNTNNNLYHLVIYTDVKNYDIAVVNNIPFNLNNITQIDSKKITYNIQLPVLGDNTYEITFNNTIFNVNLAKYIKDFKELKIIYDYLKKINIPAFENIKNSNSYKITLLNYLKINSILKYFKKTNFDKFIYYSFNDELGGIFKDLTLNPPLALGGINQPAQQSVINLNVKPNPTAKVDINEKIKEYNVNNGKDYTELDDKEKLYLKNLRVELIRLMIQEINTRNEQSYFYKFIMSELCAEHFDLDKYELNKPDGTALTKDEKTKIFTDKFSNYFDYFIELDEETLTPLKQLKFSSSLLDEIQNRITPEIYPCDDSDIYNQDNDDKEGPLKLFNNYPAAPGVLPVVDEHPPGTPNTANNYIHKYLQTEHPTDIYTVGKEPLHYLRLRIIKQLLDRYKAAQVPEIEVSITRLNASGITGNTDKLRDELFIEIANKMIIELYNRYKHEYAKIKLSNILEKILKRDTETVVDLRKLSGIDFRYVPAPIIFERIIKEKYYYYNYLSQDEDQLCYKNNYNSIKSLLDDSTINYSIKDSDGNSILHYLVKIENFELFDKIYNNTLRKFDRFKLHKNLDNLTPFDIIEGRIKDIKDEFYITGSLNKLKFSEIYSEKLVSELRLNNELHKMVPLVENLFNNMYIIFNLKDNNTDIFSGKISTYNDLMTYNIVPIWNLSNYNDTSNVPIGLYKFIKDNKYKINEIERYLKHNEYYKRFWDTMVHIITLYVTNVFYYLVLEFLNNNAQKLGITVTEAHLKEFKDSLFIYNNIYDMTELNLAQTIVVNLYKIKYDETTIIESNNLTSFKPILKSFMNKLEYVFTIKEKESSFDEHMDKIYNYMSKYFDILKPKILLFLNNYVIFLELHYNLIQIRETIKPT